MSDSVWVAALYGAIGGGAGAFLGTLLAMPLRNSRFFQIATTVLVVSGAMIGMNISEPLLKPYIGQYLPSSDSDFDTQFDAMMVELNEDPLVAALLTREPKMRDEFRADLMRIMSESATPALARSQAFLSSANLVAKRLSYYTPRAQDDDLVDFVTVITDGLEVLSSAYPQFCYDYLYNPAGMSMLSIDDIKERLGAEQQYRQQAAAGRLVERAYDDIPSYDVEVGAAGFQRAVDVLQLWLNEDQIGLVSGVRGPKDDVEAKLVCDASASMYRTMLAEEQPAVVLRHLFVLTYN